MKRNLGFRTEFGSTKTRVVVFRTKKRCDFSKKGMGLFGYCKPDSVARPVGVEGGTETQHPSHRRIRNVHRYEPAAVVSFRITGHVNQ